ncbi:MAG TPA: ATP-binding protein [Gemmatimonadaceae bacterium]
MWGFAIAVATLALAGWLRATRVEYLAVAWAATLLSTAFVARRPGRERVWRGITTALVVLACAITSLHQREIGRASGDWPRYSAELRAAAAARMGHELGEVQRQLVAAARSALAAPRDRERAFDALGAMATGVGERGVVLYEGGNPYAWAGTLRVSTDTLTAPLGAAISPFYTTLYATASAGPRRAVAAVLVHAEPPADRFSVALDALVARRTGVHGFAAAIGTDPSRPGAPGVVMLPLPGSAPLTLAARAASQAETQLTVLERARVRGGLLLAVALAGFLATMWRARRALRVRFAALAVPLLCVAIVPLNELSNVSRLFDPTLYFAPLGGPYTGSLAALAITGAVLLLGLLAVLRSPFVTRSRVAAAAAVLAVAGLGPFLLRDLARGVQPPATGVPATLWLAWETALFLAAVALVVAGASAGRTALGGRRGLSSWVAPAIATLAGLIGTMSWTAPGRWPGWYPVLWVAAIAALTLTRRSSRFVASASIVAALGASTLVWGATARKRVDLATRDVEALRAPDDYALALLDRFAHLIESGPAPRNTAELLSRYVASDLAAAQYPVAMASWDAAGVDRGRFETGRFTPPTAAVQQVVAEARGAGTPVLRPMLGELGVALVLAVPAPDGSVTSVLVLPRTRLVADDPYAPLLGAEPLTTGEVPYTLSLTGADSVALSGAGRDVWRRIGNELHGDWLVRTVRGLSRAHAEVELRPVSALVQRGLLVVLFNLGIVALLWMLSALADGGYARWIGVHARRWSRSYRLRLTLVLFAFFVLPAVAFAFWSYRELQRDDRHSQELLVREALRAVAEGGAAEAVTEVGVHGGPPLLRYDRGVLAATSDTLYDALAPFGRFLPPPVYLTLALSDEVTASEIVPVGGTAALLGYRAVTDTSGQRVVLAAPATSAEESLDQRRRDLSVLVMFLTALGALAALGLSGVAARELARPIGELRGAALAIASGEREPALAAQPTVEFRPVYSAFRRMATDLGESREALVEARRRTEAVLRTVASGVVATDGQGRVTLANPRADALLGRTVAAGSPLDTLGSAELSARIRAFLGSSAEDADFELEIGRRQLRGHLTRLSRGAGAVLTLDDVTDLAQAQRVLAWGEMARQVAHEIKNPLTPIRLGIQHLRRAFGAGRTDFPQILDQNATRILAEIDRLDEIARSFSRYGTAPQDQPPAEPVDVAPILRGVVELEHLGEEGVAFTLRGAERPRLAMARVGELRDVLVNVAENARLAGARNVDIDVAAENGRVRIAMRDDGEGIASDVLPRIFEPHFSTRTSGSGLGLAISRRLIDGWGGSIAVESERGRGTTVTITLRAAGGPS